MKIVAVDDEKFALESLVDSINEAIDDAEIVSFQKPSDAIKYLKSNSCNIIFLDINMYEMNGIDLARKLKILYHNLNIIFVTAYSEYMHDAFSMHASGYVLKPVTANAIRREVENLRYPVYLSDSRLRIQTFGNFEVFSNDNPLTFKRAKAKELLALLIDRKGAGVTTAQIASVLWENKEYNRSLKNQVQNIIIDLYDTLKSIGAENILIKKWNYLAIDVNNIDCDYYKFLNGDPLSINRFTGEYMANYSWSEFTNGYLYSASEAT